MGIFLAIMWVSALIGILAFGGNLITTYYMRTPKNFILLIIAIGGIIWSAFLIKNFITTEGWYVF